MSIALDLLETVARNYQREQSSTDPELVRQEEAYQTQWTRFTEQHGQDCLLCEQVLGILDLRDTLEECHNQIHFRMGLQLGLELGAVNILQEK